VAHHTGKTLAIVHVLEPLRDFAFSRGDGTSSTGVVVSAHNLSATLPSSILAGRKIESLAARRNDEQIGSFRKRKQRAGRSRAVDAGCHFELTLAQQRRKALEIFVRGREIAFRLASRSGTSCSVSLQLKVCAKSCASGRHASAEAEPSSPTTMCLSERRRLRHSSLGRNNNVGTFTCGSSRLATPPLDQRALDNTIISVDSSRSIFDSSVTTSPLATTESAATHSVFERPASVQRCALAASSDSATSLTCTRRTDASKALASLAAAFTATSEPSFRSTGTRIRFGPCDSSSARRSGDEKATSLAEDSAKALLDARRFSQAMARIAEGCEAQRNEHRVEPRALREAPSTEDHSGRERCENGRDPAPNSVAIVTVFFCAFALERQSRFTAAQDVRLKRTKTPAAYNER
jgi:hypothetical protein